MSRNALRAAAVKVMSEETFRTQIADPSIRESLLRQFDLEEKEKAALLRLAGGEDANVALSDFFENNLPY